MTWPPWNSATGFRAGLPTHYGFNTYPLHWSPDGYRPRSSCFMARSIRTMRGVGYRMKYLFCLVDDVFDFGTDLLREVAEVVVGEDHAHHCWIQSGDPRPVVVVIDENRTGLEQG